MNIMKQTPKKTYQTATNMYHIELDQILSWGKPQPTFQMRLLLKQTSGCATTNGPRLLT